MMLYNYYCGNPTKYKGEVMSWARGRLLTSYNKNGTKYTFSYDINGIRRKKSTSAGYTEYLVSDGKLIGQNYYASGASEPSKKITFVYTHNGLTGCVIDKMTYVYHKDVFGNVVALMSGVMPVAYYQYDAWGNCKVLNPNGTENTDPNFAGNVNPIRYRSYYYDADIGLYYLQTRYYDPETGRFISPDGIEYLAPEQLNGLNLYAYCNNNPVMNVDPDGTFALGAFLIGLAIVGITALLNAVDGGVSAVINEQDFWAGAAAGFIGGTIGGTISVLSSLIPGFSYWGNVIGRVASSAIYDILNEVFQTGSLNNMDWKIFGSDIIMDGAFSMVYIGSVGNGIIGATIGGVFDSIIDMLQTASLFKKHHRINIDYKIAGNKL